MQFVVLATDGQISGVSLEIAAIAIFTALSTACARLYLDKSRLEEERRHDLREALGIIHAHARLLETVKEVLHTQSTTIDQLLARKEDAE